MTVIQMGFGNGKGQTPGAVLGPRRLASFIDAFSSFTEGTGSPALFRKWAAISCVAGALERRVWIRMRGKQTFPNLYVCLVGPPGVGKSVVTTEVQTLWVSLEKQHIAPSSVTASSLIDALNLARRQLVRPTQIPPIEEYNSLKVLSNELGTMITGYDNEFMNYLTDIYDNSPFHQTRRTGSLNVKIPKPQLNLLAGTTPGYLGALLPPGAWDQGFLSRTLLVYAGTGTDIDPFDDVASNSALHNDLLHDIGCIGRDELFGEMSIAPDALVVLKRCIISSMSRTDDLVMELQDVQQALDWLLEAEYAMKDIFRAMSGGGDSAAIQECWYYCYQIHLKEKKPIDEHRIVGFLSERVPSHAVQRVLEVMVKSYLLKPTINTVTGQPAYTPQAKTGPIH
jgi:hypothetical protein